MMNSFSFQAADMLSGSLVFLSDLKPSEWTEKNRVMGSHVSPFPGPFSYARTPYLPDIVNCVAPYHPARIIAVMKGAQIGFSTGVIEAGIGYIISENPGNILFLSGHAELSEEAMNLKIDDMIDSCGLRPLIRPNVIRKKNQRTGDTAKSKEFPGGSLTAGAAGNHSLLRQRSCRYGYVDDFDGVVQQNKKSGSTRSMIEQRFAAYGDKMKLFYISTPELKNLSNIEPVYLLGDQRRFFLPCPCCGDQIFLEWEIEIEGSGGEKGGINYKLDEKNRLIEGSVGYICQKCGEFFDESHKFDMLKLGEWKPTAEPSEPGYYSFHLSSLYAPPGMYNWTHYVRKYLEACPPGGKRNEDLYKAFVNLVLGHTYEEKGESPRANDLQKNCRSYKPGVIPESISIKDGNGRIVLLTCACDLNGKEDDARLDYEVVAWAETGASYSVIHGSIGTFIPRENSRKHKEDRERWTYDASNPRSVWKEFEKIVTGVFPRDVGNPMKILLTGVDTGHFTLNAYAFIDRKNLFCVGLKGKDVERAFRHEADKPLFTGARERTNLFLAEVNYLKDDLAERIRLRYDPGNDDGQPAGFMNFPSPEDGLYQYGNYFSHYEAEHRVVERKDGQPTAARWVKKNSIVQNHFFDVHIYNMVTKDIITSMVCKEMKVPVAWNNFVSIAKGEL